jgi:hypothetical protein
MTTYAASATSVMGLRSERLVFRFYHHMSCCPPALFIKYPLPLPGEPVLFHSSPPRLLPNYTHPFFLHTASSRLVCLSFILSLTLTLTLTLNTTPVSALLLHSPCHEP